MSKKCIPIFVANPPDLVISPFHDVEYHEPLDVIYFNSTLLDLVDIDFFNSAGIFVNSKKTVKGSVNEGGIRVPAIIYYKGVLEDAISNQFIWYE